MSKTAKRGLTQEELQAFLNRAEEVWDMGGDVPWGELLEWLEARDIITPTARARK